MKKDGWIIGEMGREVANQRDRLAKLWEWKLLYARGRGVATKRSGWLNRGISRKQKCICGYAE